jgi:hypothetical protein
MFPNLAAFPSHLQHVEQTRSALFASANVQALALAPTAALTRPVVTHRRPSQRAVSTPLRFHCEVILVEVQASALTLHGTENASRSSRRSSVVKACVGGRSF